MAKRPGDDLSELKGVMTRAHGRGVRSPLYRWMHARHDELLDVFARPRWEAVAEFFAGKGIKDGDGKPALPETVRATWYRVRQDVDTARRKKEGKPSRVLTPDEIAPGVRTITPQPDRVKPRVDLRPAMPRGETSPAPIAEQPKQAAAGEMKDASHAAGADERIKAVLDQLGGRGAAASKLPKQVE